MCMYSCHAVNSIEIIVNILGKVYGFCINHCSFCEPDCVVKVYRHRGMGPAHLGWGGGTHF